MTDELLQLLALQIPEPEMREDGFLEITGQTHKENVNSQVYAFFLDSNRQQSVAELFRDALLHLIKEKTEKELEFDEFTVATEVSTDKGNRIDILLTDAGNVSAIIIENKIYHLLHNDLEDYWNSTKTDEEKKVGVILTLEKIWIDSYPGSERFVNIRHIEWIEEIKRRGLPAGLSNKYYVYLNDFFNSIEQLTKDITMNEQVKFFFEHQQQVIKAHETLSQAQKYVENQVAAVAAQLSWETYGNNGRWLQMWPAGQQEDVVFSVKFVGLLKPPNKKPEIEIIIQLHNEACDYEPHLKGVLSDMAKHVGLQWRDRKGSNWSHFAFKSYEPTTQQLEHLTEFIVGEINGFLPVYNKVVEELRGLEKKDNNISENPL